MKSVFLVEDLQAYHQVVARLFRRLEGFHIVGTAVNGEEALEKAPSLKPDLILIDIRMPVMSGLEAIPRLRSLLPSAGIIVLTVLDEEAYRVVSTDIGADAYVNKSQLINQLPVVMQRVVEQKRNETEPPGRPYRAP